MTDTGLPTETREGCCPWHPVHGFQWLAFSPADKPPRVQTGWRVVPVTITITATAAVSQSEDRT